MDSLQQNSYTVCNILQLQFQLTLAGAAAFDLLGFFCTDTGKHIYISYTYTLIITVCDKRIVCCWCVQLTSIPEPTPQAISVSLAYWQRDFMGYPPVWLSNGYKVHDFKVGRCWYLPKWSCECVIKRAKPNLLPPSRHWCWSRPSPTCFHLHKTDF